MRVCVCVRVAATAMGVVGKWLAEAEPGDAVWHRLLRRATDRWRLRVLPGRRVHRFLATIQLLRKRVQPKVVAAMLRSVTNCWITGRRMQRRCGRCIMGCDAEHSVENCASCRHILLLGTTDLTLQPLPAEDRLAGFLGLLHGRPEDHGVTVCRRALLTTVAYKLHGWWRHSHGPPLPPGEMQRALRVQLREALAAMLGDAAAASSTAETGAMI